MYPNWFAESSSGVLNEKIFKIDLLLAQTIIWQSPSVLWLIINSRGKIISAPQSQLAVDNKMDFPARICAIEPFSQPGNFIYPFFPSKQLNSVFASKENN